MDHAAIDTAVVEMDGGGAAEGLVARRLAGRALDAALLGAHRRTQAILADLASCRSAIASGWDVPLLATINPPLWEYGHLAWFAEWWVLRDPRPALDAEGPWLARRPSMLEHADRWFDSARVAHDTRWHLELPPRRAIDDYVERVLDGVRTRLASIDPGDDAALEPIRLALFHEDMHGEALVYLRQTLDYPAPSAVDASLERVDAQSSSLPIPGGTFVRGTSTDDGFAFDNEMPSVTTTLAPFEIDRDCVSNRAYRDFVEAGGYRDARLWSAAGRRWLASSTRTHPARWRADASSGSRWLHRWFGEWQPLPLDRPVCHVNAFEAEAYAAWVGRRLPRETEWEQAATTSGDFRWGRAVWEWTADPFEPHPGFRAGRYREYSAPWFGTHRSVRGASFATHARMRHPRYRNFYMPERDDLFIGFRTCVSP